jgi:hypothetical protein
MGFVFSASPHQPPPSHSQTKSSPNRSNQNSRPKTPAPAFTFRFAPSPPIRIQRPRSSPRRCPSLSLLSSSSTRRQRNLATKPSSRQNLDPFHRGVGTQARSSRLRSFRAALLVIDPTFVPPKRPSHRASNKPYDPHPRYRSSHRSDRSGFGSPSHQPTSHPPSTGANRRSLRQHCHRQVAPPIATTAPNPKEQTQR